MTTRTLIPANGSLVTLNIPFPYIDRAHVKLRVNGSPWAFQWVGPGKIEALNPAPNGTSYLLYRETPENPLVSFKSSSSITKQDLDLAAMQGLYRAEEAADLARDSLGIGGIDGLVFDARDRKITNLAEPTGPTDAVTKAWAESAMTSQLSLSMEARREAQEAADASEAAQREAATSAANALSSEVASRSSEVAAAGHSTRAQEAASEAEGYLDQYRNLDVEVEGLPTGEDATVVYDPETSTILLGIPAGPQGERGVPFAVSASGPLEERGLYDGEEDGFSFLSEDTGNLYILTGGTWSVPIPFRGPEGKSAYEVAVEDGFEGTREDWLVAQKGEDGFSYATRAEAKAARVPNSVTRITVDGIFFSSDENGTALRTADGRRWSPQPVMGEYTTQMWGTVADGKVDDQPAIQAAVDWLCENIDNWTLRFLPGDYRISDEIDLSAARMDHCILGEHRLVTILPDPFGATKACFRLAKSKPVKMWGFYFGNGTAHKDHPMGIFADEAGRMNFGDITGAGLGNTVIWTTRPFNADWSGPMDLFFCGWQPLHKEITTGSSGATLTSDGDMLYSKTGNTDDTEKFVFEDSDVGKDIIVYHDPNNNEAVVYRIVERIWSYQVRVDRQVIRPFTNARFSFGPITAGTNGTGDRLIFQNETGQAGLTSKDVGRFIYVDRSGRNGETHVTKIKAIWSNGDVVLEDPVVNPGTDARRVFFTPTVYVGSYGISGTGPNDIYMDHLLIEGFKGPGLLIDGGLHIKIGELKTHGRTWGEFSNFGMTAEALIWNGAHKSFIDRWELEFCAGPAHGAPIRVAGSAPGLEIGYMSHNSPSVGGSLFDIHFADTEKSYVGLPTINGRSNIDRYREVVATSSPNVRRRVNWKRIGGISHKVEASAQGPQMIGSVRSVSPWFLGNGESVSFKTASAAGFVTVAASDTPNIAGLFAFWQESTVCHAGNSATNQIGTAGKLNVSCSGGVMTIQNNTGVARRFYVAMLG